MRRTAPGSTRQAPGNRPDGNGDGDVSVYTPNVAKTRFCEKRKITNKKYVQIRTNKNGGEHKSFYKKDCPPYGHKCDRNQKYKKAKKISKKT